MSLSDERVWLALLLALAVGFVAYHYLRRVNDHVEKMAALGTQPGQHETLPLAITPRVSTARLTKNRHLDVDIPAWHSSWKFPQKDVGAFTFKAYKDGGLLVSLSDGMQPWRDNSGYVFVIDDNNQDKPKSWVGKMPYFTREMSGSKLNHGYRMPKTPKCGEYWVIYRGGTMWMGEGSEPGKGRLIMAAKDPFPEKNIKYFGFGSWGRNVGWGEKGPDVNDGLVTDIRIWPDVPSVPNENAPVHCAGRTKNAHMPCRTVPKPFVTRDLEHLFPLTT